MKSLKTNWWLDAVLFIGFLLTFMMDVTGLELHQWIGILIGVCVLVHLVAHLDWVATVISRFFGKTSASARLNLVIDMGLGLGFMLITFTGLIISTWLNLTFIDFDVWKNIHVVSSILTLFALLLKIFLHRKWIVNVAEKHIFGRQPQPAASSVLVPQMAARVNRREFLKVGALLGAGTIVGVAQIHKILEDVVTEKVSSASTAASTSVVSSSQAISQMTPAATAVVQPTASPTEVPAVVPTTGIANTGSQPSTACSVNCPRGCSFPGRCRRYVDSNGNGKCDHGECL